MRTLVRRAPLVLRPLLAAIAAFLVMMIALISAPFAVFAQDVVDTTVDFSVLVDFVLPIVLTIVTAIIGVTVPLAATYANRRWNIQIEDSRRDALQTSLTNAAAGAIAAWGEAARQLKPAIADKRTREIVQRVINGAPDAVAFFSLTQDSIAQRVVEAVEKQLLAAGSVPPTPISAPPSAFRGGISGDL